MSSNHRCTDCGEIAEGPGYEAAPAHTPHHDEWL